MTVIDKPIPQTASRRSVALLRTVDRVPGNLTAALATGITGAALAFMSLWPRINGLNEFGTFGMRMSFLLLVSFPLSVVAISILSTYRVTEWKNLGNVRMYLTSAFAVIALAGSIVSAVVMYLALP